MKVAGLLKIWVESTLFRRVSLGLILAASLIVGLETFEGLPQAVKTFLKRADQVILVWFVIEILLRILSYGRKPHHFFLSGWNVFDFLIVAVSICPAASPAFAVFRLLRVLRVLRLISGIPDLQILVGALLKSLPSMGYVGLLLFLIVYVYAVLGVHLFRATDPEHFGHLGLAFLSLFQIITLEGWAEIFRPQLEIYGWPAVIYFVSFILMGTMILLNLLIGVVLRSMEQVQHDLHKSKEPCWGGIDGRAEELSALIDEIKAKYEYLRSDMKQKKMSAMNHLDKLEAQSIYILREAYANFKNLALLWSIGKDSTVLLWLSRKAFFGHVPYPLVHVDTTFKFPEMIEYRNRIAIEWKLNLVIGMNETALKTKQTFPDGAIDRLSCCKALKSIGLKQTLDGSGPRYILDLKSHEFVPYEDKAPYTGVILGVRADEEGSRSKERYFSPRDKHHDWNVADQPPELWNQFKTDFAPGTHIRIHPLLDWTELDIWDYIKREDIPMIPLYYDQGKGERYRSVGCHPCTSPVCSKAKNVDDIIAELRGGKFSNVAERSGRAQDKEDGGLESLRREGYM